MSNHRSSSYDAASHAAEAGGFAKRLPEAEFDPDSARGTCALALGPQNTWICDGCGEEARKGVVVFSDPGNPRRYPQGNTCVINVFCARHRPRHQAYELPLTEFRDVAATMDSFRHLHGKLWFGEEEAAALRGRHLRGLHVASASR